MALTGASVGVVVVADYGLTSLILIFFGKQHHGYFPPQHHRIVYRSAARRHDWCSRQPLGIPAVVAAIGWGANPLEFVAGPYDIHLWDKGDKEVQRPTRSRGLRIRVGSTTSGYSED